jgi:hypothetical protein
MLIFFHIFLLLLFVFQRQADGDKLRAAGIHVDRMSPFPNTAPTVGQ